LLNYDHHAPAENIKVRLDLSGLVDLRETKDLSRWKVKVLSPDTAQPKFAGLSLHGSVCEFMLDRIEHYTVVTLSSRPAPWYLRIAAIDSPLGTILNAVD
jgi:hypothetical protein